MIVRKLFSEESENCGQIFCPVENSFISSYGNKSRGISEQPQIQSSQNFFGLRQSQKSSKRGYSQNQNEKTQDIDPDKG